MIGVSLLGSNGGIEVRTALLTASYIDGAARFERMKRFILWHERDESHLGLEDPLYFSDNGSSQHYIKDLPKSAIPLRYTESLERGHGAFDYPYCWRHLYTFKILIQLGYQKIIFIDSDCYVVSERLSNHICELKLGWETFWIERYGFPSAELHILCEDAFPIYEKFTSIPYADHVGKILEPALPYTKINRDFRVDRWGEIEAPQEPWMDAYCQTPSSFPLSFSKK